MRLISEDGVKPHRGWALAGWAVSELHWRETAVHEELVVTVWQISRA